MADALCPPDGRDVAILANGALVQLHRHGVALGPEGRRGVVESVATRLATMAGHDACPDARRRALLGWRDRLSSYVLAAEALDEIDVHTDAADQFLRRGLEELVADADARQLTTG